MKIHRTLSRGYPLAALLSLLPLGACGADAGGEADAEPVASTAETITGPYAQPAVQWQLDREAIVFTPTGWCSGTRIASRWVMTAAHCGATVGTTAVQFYTTGPSFSASPVAHTVNVVMPPGINSGNTTDVNGDFGDVALLELDQAITVGTAATIGWTYPGPGQQGVQVGAGSPDNAGHVVALQQTANWTDSGDDSGGGFHTSHDFVDHGDSGGPFYFGGRVLGDLYGYGLDGNVNHDFYTSAPFRLDWILSNIGFRWAGGPLLYAKALSGNVEETFTGSNLVCQYACSQRSDCVAYTWTSWPETCSLLTSVTGVSSNPQMISAFRDVAPRRGDPSGYVRSDGYSSVVHRSTSGQIHELYFGGSSWGTGVLNGTGNAAGRPSPYVRSDGTNAVVYRDTSGDIHEISLSSAGWTTVDLTAQSGAPPAAGDPSAYVRADGVNAVVYRSTSNHVIELSLVATWVPGDLTAISGAPACPGEPSGYARSDGVSSVVLRCADAHVHEIFLTPGANWGTNDISAIASAPSATSDAFGYVRSDRTNAIVYVGADAHVHELFLGTSNWQHGDLSAQTGAPAAIGNPSAYVRSDAVDSVLVRATSGDVVEIALTPTGWTQGDLTAWGGPPAAGDPTGYVRSDGTNAVVFRTSQNHVEELSLGARGWAANDLTSAAGETP